MKNKKNIKNIYRPQTGNNAVFRPFADMNQDPRKRRKKRARYREYDPT